MVAAEENFKTAKSKEFALISTEEYSKRYKNK